MVRLTRTWLQSLELTREEGSHRAALCLAACDGPALLRGRGGFLHGEEEAQWQRAGVAKRQEDYLRGRYCAKEVLCALRPALAAPGVCVASGIFGQPVVRGAGVSNLQVSIAHCGGWAAALAFDEGHPMGIDIEAHEASHGDILRREMTTAERAELVKAGIAEPLSLTLLWAAKEALGKVLRTGLMTPMTLYEVNAVERTRDGGIICNYPHFAQYKCQAGFVGGLAVAIALPRKSFLQLDWRLLTV